MFWAFRGDKKTTDEGFSNFFEFISQMLFFKGYSLDYLGNNDLNNQDEKSLLTKILNPERDAIKGLSDLKDIQLLIAKSATAFIGKKTNNDDFVNAIMSAKQNIDDVDGKEILELQENTKDSKNLLEQTKAEILAYLHPEFRFKKSKDLNADDFKNSFIQYEEIFCSEENLLFLFNSLDKLYEILCPTGRVEKINVNNLFNSIENFTSFFWNTKSGNSLFERIVINTKNEDARNKVLLFAILHFMIKYDLSELNDTLKSYIRIIRNLLQATRQRNETKYNTNIRINNFGSYWLLFDQLSVQDVYKEIQKKSLINKGSQISDASLKNEIEKVKILQSNDLNTNFALQALENLEEFGGLIHQLKPQENHSKFQNYLEALKDIWSESISDTLRIQALIACGFGGLNIKNTKMGETYYFGKKGNWTVILTNDEIEISKNILSLLDTYNHSIIPETEQKLQAIIDNWLVTNKNDRSFRYYLLKYPEFTSKLNYFVWPNDYEIRLLGTEGSNPLVAHHISPFVLKVCRKINNKNICDENQCYLQYSGNSPLTLINGLTMTSTIEGWLIPIDPIIIDSIILKYSLIVLEDNYLLKDNDKMDRIEIAVDFINDILK